MEFAADWLQPACAGLMNIALALLVGSALFFRRLPENVLLVYARVGLLLFGLALLGDMVAGTAAMSDSAPTASAVWLMLTQTQAGHLLALALFGALVLLAALCLPRPGAARHGLYVAGVLLLALSRAASGHAGDEGFFSAAVFVHSLHIIAGTSWVGAVLVYVLLRGGIAHGQPAALAQELSDIATLALLTVAGTGLIDFSRSLAMAASMSNVPVTALGRDFWLSPYMQLLALKLGAVGTAVALGGLNRWIQLPRLNQGKTEAVIAFRRIASVEVVILVFVLVLAAKLGATMPGE